MNAIVLYLLLLRATALSFSGFASVGFQQEGTLHSQNLSPLTCPLA